MAATLVAVYPDLRVGRACVEDLFRSGLRDVQLVGTDVLTVAGPLLEMMGVPHDQVRRLVAVVSAGDCIVAVRCPREQRDKAITVLQRHDPIPSSRDTATPPPELRIV